MPLDKVTFKDMEKARDKFKHARFEYTHKYFLYLETVIEEAGFLNKLVQLKDSGLRGQFKVSDDPSTFRPWEIKFYPLTKSGTISMKSKYIRDFYNWKEDSLIEQLLNIAEVVGDLP